MKSDQRAHQPADSLRHALDQQHARHQRITGKVAFEYRALASERADRSHRALLRTRAAMRSII